MKIMRFIATTMIFLNLIMAVILFGIGVTDGFSSTVEVEVWGKMINTLLIAYLFYYIRQDYSK